MSMDKRITLTKRYTVRKGAVIHLIDYFDNILASIDSERDIYFDTNDTLEWDQLYGGKMVKYFYSFTTNAPVYKHRDVRCIAFDPSQLVEL